MHLIELYKSHLVEVRNVCPSIRPACVKVVANHLALMPVIMLVSWDGMMKSGGLQVSGSDGIEWRSSYMEVGPTTRIQLSQFDDIRELDRWVVRGAATVGAWDVIRSTLPEQLGAGMGINKSLVEPVGGDFRQVDYADVERCLSKRGSVIWKFRPVFGSLRECLRDDSSLDACGKRSPNYPIPDYIPVSDETPTVQYRIGAERRMVPRQRSSFLLASA